VGCLVLALTLLAWSRTPEWNWDMLAYAAIALDESDDKVVHARLWGYVERDVPLRAQARLRGDPGSLPSVPFDPRREDTLDYRRNLSQDPAGFAEQLPFYSVKPMYPAAIALATQFTDFLNRIAGAGANGVGTDSGPVLASVLVTRICWVGFGTAFFLCLRLRFSIAPAVALTLITMSLPMARLLAGYSTPDAMSAMLMLLAFVLVLRDPSRVWTLTAIGVTLLGIAARPDNLLLLNLLLLWLLVNRRVRFSHAVFAGALGLAWCLLLSELSNNYGWLVLVHHSFVDYMEYPSQLEVRFTAATLFDLYVAKLPESVRFFQFMAVGCSLALLRWHWRGISDQLVQALLVMLAFMLAHWLLFPDQKERLMVAPYLFILASVAFVAADWLSSRREWMRETHG